VAASCHQRLEWHHPLDVRDLWTRGQLYSRRHHHLFVADIPHPGGGAGGRGGDDARLSSQPFLLPGQAPRIGECLGLRGWLRAQFFWPYTLVC
jgi:hypothetical protein